jgi:translation initiation factor IF-3
VLLKFAERLAEIGQVEGLPKLEGKRMLMVIAPKSQKKKVSSGSAPAEPQG